MLKTVSETERSSNSRSTPPRWMVVDDNAAILQMMSSFLTAVSDARISVYGSGHEALAAFSAEPEAFQLVITDLEMPRMNGLELNRHLRALKPDLKVVLITGNYRGVEKALAEENKLSGFLYKPFSLDSLQKLLQNIGLLSVSKPEVTSDESEDVYRRNKAELLLGFNSEGCLG